MNQFQCPPCQGYISTSNQIVFTAESESGIRGLVCLSAELGNYNVAKNENFELRDGEFVKLYCPLCHTNLVGRTKHKNLAEIILITPENKRYPILFSGIVGEHCTYKVQEGKIAESYGIHAGKYDLDFEGLIELM